MKVCRLILLIFHFSEPDIGMPQADAQKYFKQLIIGLVSIQCNLINFPIFL